MPTVYVRHLAVYLRWFTDDWAPADTRAWLRIFEQEVDSRQPTDGRGCREKWRGDRLEMYGHGRLPTLTDADSRCGAFATSACDRVNPYPSVISSHHPQEVLLAQFSLYVHKGGLKPDSFHFYPSVIGPLDGEGWGRWSHLKRISDITKYLFRSLVLR